MLRIRPFADADRDLGLRLSRQAGWNQMDADWRRLFDLQPEGGFVAEWQETPVGTAMTLRFGPVAWVAMVLVDAAVRGRGIGTALVKHAVDALDRQGLATIRLDATSLGHPLYERLGFVAQSRVLRYEGTLPPTGPTGGAQPVGEAQWDELAALDRSATSTDRRRLLFALFREHPGSLRCVRRAGTLVGYLTSRPGFLATQLGPCCADVEAGELLLRDAWQRHAGTRVFWDVPAANAPAVRLAETMGLKVQREFLRMCRGVPVDDRADSLWASAGPEKG
jgi:GNAT superfamily N-acetyltransferase